MHEKSLAPDGSPEEPIADLLESLPEELPDEHFRLQELLDVLGKRSMSSALLLLTIPQLLPLPLFVANVLALPILLVSVQILMGRQTPWLPSWVMERPFRRRRLEQLCRRVVPVMRWLEKLVRPRLTWVWSKGATLIGFACVTLSLIAVAPLPFIGWLPGWSLFLIALGLLQRDGLLILVALALGTAAVGVFAGVVIGLFSVGEAVASGSDEWLRWFAAT